MPASQDGSARRRGPRAALPAPRLARRATNSATRSVPAPPGVERLDQPRIAIDQERRRAVIGHDVIDRQERHAMSSAAPKLFQVSAHDRRLTLCLIASPPPTPGLFDDRRESRPAGREKIPTAPSPSAPRSYPAAAPRRQRPRARRSRAGASRVHSHCARTRRRGRRCRSRSSPPPENALRHAARTGSSGCASAAAAGRAGRAGG